MRLGFSQWLSTRSLQLFSSELEVFLRRGKPQTLQSSSFELHFFHLFLSTVLQAWRKKRKSVAGSASLLLPLLAFPLTIAYPQSQRLHHPYQNCPIHGFEQVHFFFLPQQSSSSFYTVLAVAPYKHVLLYTIKEYRAICTARVLAVVHRRRLAVQCLAEMKKNRQSTRKNVLYFAKKIAHSFDRPSSFSESHREAVSFRNRVQLMQACVTATINMRKRFKIPRTAPCKYWLFQRAWVPDYALRFQSRQLKRPLRLNTLFGRIARGSCEAEKLKNRVRLVQTCVTATKNYERIVKDPKKSSLYSNGSFWKHNLLVMLSDLNHVSSQKLNIDKSLFWKIPRRFSSFAYAAEKASRQLTAENTGSTDGWRLRGSAGHAVPPLRVSVLSSSGTICAFRRPSVGRRPWGTALHDSTSLLS